LRAGTPDACRGDGEVRAEQKGSAGGSGEATSLKNAGLSG
jgi:hypothetical protein